MTTELEWREKWLPDLRACPWHPLEINGSQFVIKWFFTACSYEIIITDFASFWYEEVKDDSLTDRVKKLNPSLDVCIIQVLEHIENALEKTLQNAVLNISLEPIRDGIKHDIMLSFTSQWIGKPFIWKFYCSLQDSRISSNHMIIPLMVMVSELQRRQKELIKIIQNKDREIQEYTPQEPVPVKNNLKTEPFVETAFEMAMMTSREFVYELKNCRTNTFNASGQDLYRQVMAINAWTERSPDGGCTADEEIDILAQIRSIKGTSSPPALASMVNSEMPTPNTGSKSSTKLSFQSPQKGSSKSPKSPSEDSKLFEMTG